jgi:phospho-N-acetylmuramoyl-pentapeptide-transferase
MLTILEGTADLAHIIGFIAISAIISLALAPIIIRLLNKFRVIKGVKTELANIGVHNEKHNTPVMGGLLIIITVFIITYLFNWSRSFTYVPIGVMIISALLGGVDDLMNIYGSERRSRKLNHIINLIRIHHDWKMRVWYAITLPWTVFKRISVWFGSRPGKGIFVHEKLILQFIAGTITAWWIYSKLGPAWHFIYFPFGQEWNAGFLIFPIIIFIVMFTANAVNIADGMDGLSGGMLISTFSALTILSWINGFGEMAVLNATIVGALISYTYFNIKPARFIMGDVGSLALGALLAVNTMAIGEIAMLPLLGFMFYIEAISVVLQVLSKSFLGRKIFRMAPLHHHFELKGWSEERTVMRFWIVHFAFVVAGFYFALH